MSPSSSTVQTWTGRWRSRAFSMSCGRHEAVYVERLRIRNGQAGRNGVGGVPHRRQSHPILSSRSNRNGTLRSWPGDNEGSTSVALRSIWMTCTEQSSDPTWHFRHSHHRRTLLGPGSQGIGEHRPWVTTGYRPDCSRTARLAQGAGHSQAATLGRHLRFRKRAGPFTGWPRFTGPGVTRQRDMTHMIDPPDDRYSDSALEVWERYLRRLQRLRDSNPNDEILMSSILEAKRTIAQLRDTEGDRLPVEATDRDS